MTKKFEVERYSEVDGKAKVEKLEIELASPPIAFKEEVYAMDGQYAEELKDVKARVDANPTGYAKADYDIIVSKTIKKDREYARLLARLCVNGAISSAKDLEGVGSEYTTQMVDWMKKKLGIIKDKESEGFTKT